MGYPFRSCMAAILQPCGGCFRMPRKTINRLGDGDQSSFLHPFAMYQRYLPDFRRRPCSAPSWSAVACCVPRAMRDQVVRRPGTQLPAAAWSRRQLGRPEARPCWEPTYAEQSASPRSSERCAGVTDVDAPQQRPDIATSLNPNNPDGRPSARDVLTTLLLTSCAPAEASWWWMKR